MPSGATRLRICLLTVTPFLSLLSASAQQLQRCQIKIDRPQTYVFRDDFTCTGAVGFTIAANNVTLMLNNHQIKMTQSGAIVIQVMPGAQNFRLIGPGVITNAYKAIYFKPNGSYGSMLVEGITFRWDIIHPFDIHGSFSGAVIRNNKFVETGPSDIDVDGLDFSNNHGRTGAYFRGTNNKIMGNSIYVMFIEGDYNQIINNDIDTLWDDNPDCGHNIYKNNKFRDRNQDCIQ